MRLESVPNLYALTVRSGRKRVGMDRGKGAGKEEELGKETKWEGIELRNPTTAKLRTAKGAFFTSLAFPPNRESSRIKGELRIS
jgi:hypothetical protein